MTSGTHDYLVVVDPVRGGGLEALGESLTQVFSPRLGVVRVDDSTLAELQGRTDVVAVARRVLPPGAVAELDETERLFAEAWSQHDRPKQRRGEGLPWDAEDHSPPDA